MEQYNSCLLVLRNRIFLNKKFYVTLLLRIPLSIIIPLYFLSTYISSNPLLVQSIIFNSLLWQCFSITSIEAFMFTRNEVDNKNDMYVQLSGRNVPYYYCMCAVWMSLFFWLIYNVLIFICLKVLMADIGYYAILSLLALPVVILVSCAITLITLKNKTILFNFINVVLDVLYLISGVLYPLHKLPQVFASAFFLLPTTWIFQSSLNHSFLINRDILMTGVGIVCLVLMVIRLLRSERRFKSEEN